MPEQEKCPHCGKPLYRFWAGFRGPICYYCGKLVSEKKEEKYVAKAG